MAKVGLPDDWHLRQRVSTTDAPDSTRREQRVRTKSRRVTSALCPGSTHLRRTSPSSSTTSWMLVLNAAMSSSRHLLASASRLHRTAPQVSPCSVCLFVIHIPCWPTQALLRLKLPHIWTFPGNTKGTWAMSAPVQDAILLAHAACRWQLCGQLPQDIPFEGEQVGIHRCLGGLKRAPLAQAVGHGRHSALPRRVEQAQQRGCLAYAATVLCLAQRVRADVYNAVKGPGNTPAAAVCHQAARAIKLRAAE